MPRAVVRWYSSTTTLPSRTSTPANSASSRSPLGIRPVATSSASACNVAPLSIVRVMPEPSWLAPTTLQWLWISHFLDAMSVNRSHTVSSQCLQQRAAADDQRHARAERREGVGELGGDEAAADDDEMRRAARRSA